MSSGSVPGSQEPFWIILVSGLGCCTLKSVLIYGVWLNLVTLQLWSERAQEVDHFLQECVWVRGCGQECDLASCPLQFLLSVVVQEVQTG